MSVRLQIDRILRFRTRRSWGLKDRRCTPNSMIRSTCCVFAIRSSALVFFVFIFPAFEVWLVFKNDIWWIKPDLACNVLLCNIWSIFGQYASWESDIWFPISSKVSLKDDEGCIDFCICRRRDHHINLPIISLACWLSLGGWIAIVQVYLSW